MANILFHEKIIKNFLFLTTRFWSNEIYLKILYRIMMKEKLDLDNPITFTEKIQWLKLYDQNSLYPALVDKYEVKKYAASIIGDEYIIPTLGVWNKFEEIDFSKLPDRFVLKCTHDSGGLCICNDKLKFNFKKAKKILNKCLKTNYYLKFREYPYKNIRPRIIAEEYMENDDTKDLRDYKFFVFNEKVKTLFIATERQNKTTETKFDFFDADFNHLPIINGHPNALIQPEKPKCFEKMKELAQALSKGIPHIRVDFYEVNGKIYFGELTFSHWSGLIPFDPKQWDLTFGSWLELPHIKKGDSK